MEKRIEKAMGVTFFARDLTPARWVTVREWLADLLLRVWVEDEGFSGKRPWGNSGWQSDVAAPLIRAGIVTGELDEDDYIETCDHAELDRLITGCIQRMAKP